MPLRQRQQDAGKFSSLFDHPQKLFLCVQPEVERNLIVAAAGGMHPLPCIPECSA